MASYGNCLKAMTEYSRFCAAKGDIDKAKRFSLRAAKRGDEDAMRIH